MGVTEYTKANISLTSYLIMLQVVTWIGVHVIVMKIKARPTYHIVLLQTMFHQALFSTIRLDILSRADYLFLTKLLFWTLLIFDSLLRWKLNLQILLFTYIGKVFRLNAVNRKPLKEFCSQNIESFLEKHAFVLRDHVIGPSGSTID